MTTGDKVAIGVVGVGLVVGVVAFLVAGARAADKAQAIGAAVGGGFIPIPVHVPKGTP